MKKRRFEWETHTISMAMFNSYVTNYQRVRVYKRLKKRNSLGSCGLERAIFFAMFFEFTDQVGDMVTVFFWIFLRERESD